jgi:ATP-dependent Clp protease ATP-binding subunit ClpA
MTVRFMRDARHVITLADVEARRMAHPYLGTGHLLLGLLRDEGGTATRILASLGVTDAVVVRELDARVGRSSEELGPDDEEALRAVGIDLDEIRQRLEAAFGPGILRPPAQRRRGYRLTAQARKALGTSRREAAAVGHRYVGSEDLLLGLNTVEPGVGAQILRHLLGVPTGSVRKAVLGELRRAS